jgi:putative acetyltransferase
LNERAFGGPGEARLVDALRRRARPFVSLVADAGGTVVGHIAFSPVVLERHDDLQGMGLAPMAVAPPLQRLGLGSRLVRAGLDECRRLGAVFVVVLGHREYYPRFGFVPASRLGLSSEYPEAGEAFMCLELAPGVLAGRTGMVRYHPAFATL